MSTTLPFTYEDALKANAEWGFNCGPAALCSVLGMTPEEIRPHLGSFTGWTNPTMMSMWLTQLHPMHRLVDKTADRKKNFQWPIFGLVRIQFDGPWCDPGRPIAARYPHTHWIAIQPLPPTYLIFDVNNFEALPGGWATKWDWEASILPDVIERHPRANQCWWPTHGYEIISHPPDSSR